MRIQLLSKRYAQALFGLAVENNILEEVHADMLMVGAVLEENRVLRKVLANPVLDSYKKIKILNKLFDKKVQKLSLKFLLLITKKGREQYISFICKAFNEIYKEHKNIVEVQFTTAYKIDEELRKAMLKKLQSFTQKHLEISEKIDEEIIGGFKLNFEDYQYDASIKTQLKRLRKEFSKNLYVRKY
jgi:F-type H+-transporting ATPase subunit delta